MDDESINVRFAVKGTPVSSRAKKRSREIWQDKVKEAAKRVLPTGWMPSDVELSITIYDFPADPPQSDVDNIIKRIQDALNNLVYKDDELIKRVVAHRFLPEEYADIDELPDLVSEAIINEPPFVYLVIRSNPFSEAM